ncbi:hypothetical protein JCM10908_004100 [Rhodotorula pacifica]|uniref:chromatin DNA-binding EKC/KEOPS complex subunit PCC1 n=1 Tax=Rhodotorula pacifica TaxID=1495444 RepID=UPI00317B9B8F
MDGAPDRPGWHTITLTIPFPSPENATLVKRVIEVDKPLRPSELTRSMQVEGANLTVSLAAANVTQARVALDHLLSDIQLVTQTMARFGTSEAATGRTPSEPSLEVGLMGSWQGVQ